MKLRKIFIYINLLILFLLMLTGCTSKGKNWPRVVYQPTYWTFDNRIIDIDDNYILAMILWKQRMVMTLFFILSQNEKRTTNYDYSNYKEVQEEILQKRRRKNIEDY